MTVRRLTLYRDAALADGTEPSLRKGLSVLVDDRRVTWIRRTPDEGALPPDIQVVDAEGSTIVPGMVDAHSHVTLRGLSTPTGGAGVAADASLVAPVQLRAERAPSLRTRDSQCARAAPISGKIYNS